jgi:microsomal dipeptidase-like Zn-dependent dipeptidase
MKEKLYQQEREESGIIDLHNDLLTYLALSDSHRPDEASCCSARQLREGGVGCQVLPVFSETVEGSEKTLKKQLDCFNQLVMCNSDDFSISGSPGTIKILWAIEGVSSFLGEDESLDVGISRLRKASKQFGPPVYVSLTWNGENRCGGGVGIDKGLTDDGKTIIEALDAKTALDLSHASDQLAHDIVEYTPRFLIASHSNFRSVLDVPRNLPKEIAQEIVKRGGLIGLNLIQPFVGTSEANFFDHIEYALSRGWEEALCFGADFYSLKIVPENLKEKMQGHFFPSWENPSSMRDIAAQVAFRFGREFAHKMLWNNAEKKLLNRM